MTPQRHPRSLLTISAVLGLTLALSACGSGDPLDEDAPGNDGATAADDADATGAAAVVVGSQAYYSNEIIAEIYAQALEDAGFEVERQFQIGQRDVYLEAMAGGEVQLLPEYTGNLLQFYDAETEARSSEDVATQLPDVLPEDLAVLEYAEAQDADSYNIAAELAADNDLASLADLADYDGPITIGGNAELEGRPYGPDGLREFYGVEVDFLAIGDSGGPLTKDAIRDGTITMGDIYTADPDLASGDFVTLTDPESMILAQNVVPLVDADLAEQLAPTLDAISAVLTTDELIALNVRSQEEQLDSATIATDWLAAQGLVG